MIFNGYDFKNDLVVEYIDRTLLPPISNTTYKIPGKPGALLTSSDTGVGTISVKVRMFEPTRILTQALIRKVAGKLYYDTPKRLELRDEPDKYNMAILGGDTDLEKFLHTGGTDLKFQLLDPYAYSKQETTVALNTEFTNPGTAAGYGIISFKASAGSSVIIKSGLKELKVIFPFVGTEVMEIDLEKELITMNGNNAMKYLSLDSDFFKIEPGKNMIEVISSIGTVTFRSRWI